ncbi:MAG TPA: tetratricopeptide repeat protein [Actinocrinis sp.]|nr:tetratricopeptide repeat protein [Actinocrinis sp.]
MDPELIKLASTAAGSLVGAMTTDSWGAVKKRFARILSRGHDQEAAETEHRLETTRGELEQASRSADPASYHELRDQTELALIRSLSGLAEADPDLARELIALVADLGDQQTAPALVVGRFENTYGPMIQASQVSNNTITTVMQAPQPFIVPGTPVPRIVPPGAAHYTNHEGLLAHLAAEVLRRENPARIVNLHGEGGIGKTSTAVELVDRVSDRFPDGELYADLRGSTGEGALHPASALARFLGILGVNPQFIPGDPQWLEDLFLSRTADLRLIVLLDDAGSAAQVGPLLTRSRGSLTIITSREPLRGLADRGAQFRQIPPLPDDEARRLLDAILETGERTAGAVDLGSVARGCSGLPLKLWVEGSRLAADRDSDHEGQPPSTETRTTGPMAVIPIPDQTDLLGGYDAIPASAARLHRLLAVHAWPSITPGVAMAAGGLTDEREAAAMLTQLHRVGLIESLPDGPTGDPRYRIHERVRRQSALRALADDGIEAVTAATRAIVARHRDFAIRADSAVMPKRWHLGVAYQRFERDAREGAPGASTYPSAAAALNALELARADLVEAVVQADQHCFYDLVWQLCEGMWALFFRLGHHEEWVRVHRLGVKSATELGDLRAQGRMHAQLAFGLIGQGRTAEAERELTKAREADREAGHERGQATAIESLGLIRLAQERFEEAADLFAEAKILATRVGDPRALALLEHHTGRALSGMGHYDDAKARLLRALDEMRKLPDPYNEARVLMSLGEAALRQGRPDEASDPLKQAAAIMNTQSALVQRAQVAVLRAACAQQTHDIEAERGFLVEAKGFLQQTGAPGYAAVAERLALLDNATGR